MFVRWAESENELDFTLHAYCIVTARIQCAAVERHLLPFQQKATIHIIVSLHDADSIEHMNIDVWWLPSNHQYAPKHMDFSAAAIL